jgi:Zn-finger nucleic acid-binding protein
MKCTSCKEGQLELGAIDGLFKAHICNSCSGYWVLVEDYLEWKDKNPTHDFSDSIICEEGAAESSRALLCPVSGSLMSKFRISSTTNHRIDYSAAVGGIWLDKGEWELLVESGVAGSLSAIVTRSWQHKLRSESAKEHFAKIYSEKFGKENYSKVKAFRDWLALQPLKSDLKSYIMADDPYSAEK